MQNQLLPPIDSAPRLPARTTHAEAVRIWIDLMKSADKLLLAGLSREVGPELARESYRRWYAERSRRRTEHLMRLALRLRAVGD